MPTRVAIVGVTGYAGGELARLLLRHPEARLVAAVARSHQGEPLRTAQPHLHSAPESLVIGTDVQDAEAVFTTLPAGEAAKLAEGWLDEGRAPPGQAAEAHLHSASCPDDPRSHRHLLRPAACREDGDRRRRRLCARVRRGAVRADGNVVPGDEGDARQQLVPRARRRRRGERAARRVRRARQPREGRGGLGAAELQRAIWLSRDAGARGASAVAVTRSAKPVSSDQDVGGFTGGAAAAGVRDGTARRLDVALIVSD